MASRYIYRTLPRFSDSFAQVKAKYESIKPVVSKHHTREDDVRPFGNRRRKHERIVKFSDTKFGLCDSVKWSGGRWTLTDDAVFVWELARMYEYLTINNPACTSGYPFIDELLPSPLTLNYLRRGRKSIAGIPGHPKGVYLKERVPLTLRRLVKGGTWEVVGSILPLPGNPKVDTEAKKAVASELKELKEWALAMLPLLINERWTWSKRVGEVEQACKIIYGSGSGSARVPTPKYPYNGLLSPEVAYLAIGHRTGDLAHADTQEQQDAARWLFLVGLIYRLQTSYSLYTAASSERPRSWYVNKVNDHCNKVFGFIKEPDA